MCFKAVLGERLKHTENPGDHNLYVVKRQVKLLHKAREKAEQMLVVQAKLHQIRTSYAVIQGVITPVQARTMS